jgi:ferredoxin--NADP+ reductase
VTSVGPDIARIAVDAPRVAAHAHPGQFVIVRATRDGERIPLTISSWEADTGTIEVVVQAVGRTTHDLVTMHAGDALADVLGPLGRPTEISSYGTVVVVAGGVGAAIALPVAAALTVAGNEVVGILGARTTEHLILVREFTGACGSTHLVTEDGSSGRRGLVTDELSDVLVRRDVDRVFTVGPIAMMRAVAELTRSVPIPTVASLNPIMVDGTGMCGGCRVSVGDAQRFACVDGPEFDAHAVDFEGLQARNRAYRRFEECQLALTGVDDG